MPEPASKQPQVNSETKNQAMPVAFGDQLSGDMGGIFDIAQNLERHIRPADVMRMQRTLGNQATAKLLKRSPSALPQTVEVKGPEAESVSESGPHLQRSTTMIVKGGLVRAGTHRIFTSDGVPVAKIAGNERLEIDSSDIVKIGGDDAFAVITEVKAPKFTPIGGGNYFGLGEDEDTAYFIKSKNLKPLVAAPAASESEPLEAEADLGGGVGMGYSNGTGTVSIPIAGQTLTFSVDKSGAVSGKLEGEIPDKKIEPEIPGFDYTIDLPIPGVGAAYITAGLEIKPTFSMGFGGGAYTLNIGTGEADHTFEFNADVGGEMGVELTASVGAGVGVANVAGLSTGAFVSAESKAEMGAKLKGTITASNANGWKSGTLTLEDIAATMSVVGKAGVFVRASILSLGVTKRFKLLDKEIGVFEYKRDPISIAKGGMEAGKLNLALGDFKLKPSRNEALVDPDQATVRTPLLQSDQAAINGQDTGSL